MSPTRSNGEVTGVLSAPRARSTTERGLHALVTSTLARRILCGELSPGDTLDTITIESEFAVSRTVVREAFRALSAKGMLDARPHRGTFVLARRFWTRLDPELLRWQSESQEITTLFRELREVRGIVEPAVAELAALRRSDEALAAIGSAVERMAAVRHEPALLTQADMEFHRAVFEAAGNGLLERMDAVVEVALSLRDRLVHDRVARSRFSWPDSVEAHRAVYVAIASCDPEAASRASQRLLELSEVDVKVIADPLPAADRQSGRSPIKRGARKSPSRRVRAADVD